MTQDSQARGLSATEAALAGACTGLSLLLAESAIAAATRPSYVAALAHGAPWRLVAPVALLGAAAGLLGLLAAAALGARGAARRGRALRGVLLAAALPVLVHPLFSPPAPLLTWLEWRWAGALLAVPLLLVLPAAGGRRAGLLPLTATSLAGLLTFWLLGAGWDRPPPGAEADVGWLARASAPVVLATLAVVALLAALPLLLALRDAHGRPATRRLLVSTVVLLLALGATFALPRVMPRPSAPRDRDSTLPRTPVLIVVADTLRADHVAGFGGPADLTPHVAALARDGVSFTAASSPAPWTTPAFGSLLTGLLPLDHGAGAGGASPLRPEVGTLAQRLVQRGWTTTALTSNPLLGRQLGLARGFSRYEDAVPPEWYHPLASWVLDRVLGVAAPYLGGRAQAARALQAIDAAQAQGESWLVLAHFMDSHWPYLAPAELREPGDRGLGADYRAGARAVDSALGELLDGLRARGLYEGTLIIFTADHGEELDEQRAESAGRPPWNRHGHTLHEELLHVPLVIKLPAGDTRLGLPGEQHGEPVSLLDVAPTLLGALSERPLPGLAGLDLLSGGEAPVLAEGLLPEAGQALAARRGDWKVVVHGLPPRPESAVGFDLATDPGERSPLPLAASPELGTLYEALVLRWLRLPAAAGANGEAPPAALDEDLRRRLQQLGYLR